MTNDYSTAIKRFLTAYGCSRAVLFSRAVDEIGVQFLKMPEAVRADIRRAYMAASLPPANMMNVCPPVAWRPYYERQQREEARSEGVYRAALEIIVENAADAPETLPTGASLLEIANHFRKTPREVQMDIHRLYLTTYDGTDRKTLLVGGEAPERPTRAR